MTLKGITPRRIAVVYGIRPETVYRWADRGVFGDPVCETQDMKIYDLHVVQKVMEERGRA